MADELKKETAAAEENKTAANNNIINEKEDAPLESFLSREQAENPSKKTMKKSRKTLFIILGAVVVIAVLAALLVFLRSQPGYSEDATSQPAKLTLDVNADGIHEADAALDENGKLKADGSGTLLSVPTADVVRVDVENQNGSFTVLADTPEGEATVYTLKGFEDYDLQSDAANEVASHCATIDVTRVIAVNAKLADYGLDSPRATVTAHYADDTSAVIRVGSEAAGEAGTYLGFGTSDTVYLVPNDDVQYFLYSVNDLISLNITAVNEDSDNAQFSTLTVSGTHFNEPITLEPNTDEAIDASYIVTAPVRMIANPIEAGDIAGNIRGLYAESVVCVNPSAAQTASYGLSEPYATVEASYPDTDITLHASAPDSSGIVNVYNPDTNVIYTIQLAAVCWAKTSVEALLPENPLPAKLRFVDSIDFTAGDTSFTLDVTTTSETITDDDGNEQESYTSTATYNGKDLKEDDFNVFYQNITAVKNQGQSDSTGADTVMSVTLRYTADRSPDTLNVLSGGENGYVLELNGSVIGTASKSYINSLINGANDLISGNPVEGL